MSTVTPAGASYSPIQLLRDLGVLRIMLFALALISLPFAGSAYDPHGGLWPLISGAVVPALVPLVFMVLMFDALMARVWLSEAQGAEALRLRRVLWSDMAVSALLLVIWVPQLWAALNPG